MKCPKCHKEMEKAPSGRKGNALQSFRLENYKHANVFDKKCNVYRMRLVVS